MALIAAGAGIITGMKRPWAAALLGLMILSFVPVVDLPRIAAAPRDGNEWRSLFDTLALGGSALVLACACRVAWATPPRRG